MSPEMCVTGIQPIQGEKLHQPYFVVVPDASCVDWAKAISALTVKAHAKGDMLAKTPQEVLDIFSKRHSVVLVDEQGNLISHAGATFLYQNGDIEVGAVCTNEGKDGRGFGRTVVEELLTHLQQMYPDRKIFALANAASQPLFKKVGGREMPMSDLHKGVFDACEGCLRKPSNTSRKPACCDLPFDLTDFKPRSTAVFDVKVHVNGQNGAGHAKI